MTDPFGGRDDLPRGLIRCVGEPERRFDEDALRMLRAVRFAARLGFEIDAARARGDTSRSRRCALALCRARGAELRGILASPRPGHGLAAARTCGCSPG